MECCCHVWAGAPSCYLALLDKLQKRICRTVGRSFATSLEPWTHCRNVASLSVFYRYYFGFGRWSSELAQLVPLPFSRGRSTRYSDRLNDFPVNIPNVTRMSMSAVSFLAQLTPLKNTPTLFLPSPLLNLKTAQAPLFRQSPLYFG